MIVTLGFAAVSWVGAGPGVAADSSALPGGPFTIKNVRKGECLAEFFAYRSGALGTDTCEGHGGQQFTAESTSDGHYVLQHVLIHEQKYVDDLSNGEKVCVVWREIDQGVHAYDLGNCAAAAEFTVDAVKGSSVKAVAFTETVSGEKVVMRLVDTQLDRAPSDWADEPEGQWVITPIS
ncbi:hypothetical protein [Nocardia sp. NPDC051832]|uniref:hypothetical protein n=1 Tax=Nocardia sp. NPDC051832 TaxID=3155673 RepID=UPI003433EB05